MTIDAPCPADPPLEPAPPSLLADAVARLREILASEPVVLFMKGTRRSPACGFSSAAVDVLDVYLDDYVTIDALADATLRDAVKALEGWPTLPQLFVRGAFVGGADILREMHDANELRALFAELAAPIDQPEVELTSAAIEAFSRYAGGRPTVRVEVSPAFEHELFLDSPRDGDRVIDDPRFRLLLSATAARRLHGARIDYLERGERSGFRIDNPNEPARVRPLEPEAFRAMRESGRPHLLLDVRTDDEWDLARIEGAERLDAAMRVSLDSLDRTFPIVAVCHHGVRSHAAAEHCVRMGFREVYNLVGGIDAWAARVDPRVPRY